MKENKAREMAQAIIEKIGEELHSQKAHLRPGVVPDLDQLTGAIQTYTAARYVIYPDIWSKQRYIFPYTLVEVDWNDDKWRVQLHYRYTYLSLLLCHKVIPISGDYLHHRDGVIELVEKGMYLRRDPASGVYLPVGYDPPQEILQAVTTGPFRVELRRTVINLYPANDPLVVRYKNPGKRVELRYKQHRTRITLGSGELLAHLAMWRLME